MSDAVRAVVGKLVAGLMPSTAEYEASQNAFCRKEVEPALIAAFLTVAGLREEAMRRLTVQDRSELSWNGGTITFPDEGSQNEAVASVFSTLMKGERPIQSEMTAAFEAILRGEAKPALIAGFLTALRTRGETVDDIVAGARVLRANVRPVKAPAGAIDTCGTGGLPWTSLNTSTAVAFVAAGAGAVVAKHGNRSKSKAGSADVLEALGVNLAATDAQLEASFRDAGLAFMFAPAHHAAMKHVAPVRAALGMRTIFNMLGPLANPAGVRRQVLGVFAPEWVEPFARALQALGAERAMVVHGRDGLDEISITAPTLVADLKNGVIATYELTPSDLGLGGMRLDDLRGGSVADNASALQSVLEGRSSAFGLLVAANAAAALVVAGVATDFQDGLKKARDSITSGKAMASLEALKRASNA